MALVNELQERLDAANASSGSVGAIASVWLGGERAHAAAGLADVRADRPATVATPFRIGSIAKVCTAATLVRLLAEAGRSLDETVVEVLPGCVPDAAGNATWGHLVTHRSGIDGTFWEGFGDEPDAVRRYAEQVRGLPVVFEPGDSWGYSNSAFVLAGAAIEALTGAPFDVTTALWSPAPPEGAANGHHLSADGPRPAPLPSGTRALAPTGASGFTTADELLELADRLLADTWTDLAAGAVPMPPGGGTAATHQALGWRVYRWGDTVMFGHDGGSGGMGSFLRWIPETRTGIALLSNTNPSAMMLWADLSPWFFDQAGVTVPGWLSQEAGATVEPQRCGTYVSRDATFTISLGPETLSLDMEGLGGSVRRSVTLAPLASGIYRSDQILTDPTRIISFDSPRGEYDLLHAGPFTARRASSP